MDKEKSIDAIEKLLKVAKYNNLLGVIVNETMTELRSDPNIENWEVLLKIINKYNLLE